MSNFTESNFSWHCLLQHWNHYIPRNTKEISGCWTKNRKKHPKMDLENNGKPLLTNGWFGEKKTSFWYNNDFFTVDNIDKLLNLDHIFWHLTSRGHRWRFIGFDTFHWVLTGFAFTSPETSLKNRVETVLHHQQTCYLSIFRGFRFSHLTRSLWWTPVFIGFFSWVLRALWCPFVHGFCCQLVRYGCFLKWWEHPHFTPPSADHL